MGSCFNFFIGQRVDFFSDGEDIFHEAERVFGNAEADRSVPEHLQAAAMALGQALDIRHGGDGAHLQRTKPPGRREAVFSGMGSGGALQGFDRTRRGGSS